MARRPRERDILRRYKVAKIYLNHISVGPHRCDLRPAQQWSQRHGTFVQQALPIQFAYVNAVARQFFDCCSFRAVLHFVERLEVRSQIVACAVYKAATTPHYLYGILSSVLVVGLWGSKIEAHSPTSEP
jgi:hypothetical protein